MEAEVKKLTVKALCAFTLLMMFAYCIVLIIGGALIVNGTIEPLDLLDIEKMNGAIVMLTGFCMLNLWKWVMTVDKSDFRKLEKRVKELEDEIHGMDKEAEKES